MWPTPRDSVRAPHQSRTPRELMTSPVTALAGVSDEAARALRQFGIDTVFDLATSRLFGGAYDIDRAAEGYANGLGRFTMIPGDLLDADARALAVAELQLAPTTVLRDVGPAGGAELARTLSAATVRDLALWPPFHLARSLLSAAFAPDGGAGEDPEMPGDLVPGARRYPTQRAQYQVLVLDAARPATGQQSLKKAAAGSLALQALNALPALESAGPLDLTTIAREVRGGDRMMPGTLLIYTQSWYTEGLALGQLLHTLALAPGESTRIAMIDWARAARAGTREGITESEALSSTLSRGRAISETVNSVMKEAQSGFSGSIGRGSGTQVGTASGGAGSADLSSTTGMPLNVAGGSGESTGFGSSMGMGASVGWSSGQRDLSATMAQNIQDTTQQASNLVRSRWATVVTEVTESEQERLTTRTVTNYNHMHALSIEYFEIVQLHRVVVELTRAERCVFVPFRVFDFTNRDILWRYRREIARSALLPPVAQFLAREPDAVALVRPDGSSDWDETGLRALAARAPGRVSASAASREVVVPLDVWTWEKSHVSVAPAAAFDAVVLERHDGPDRVLSIGLDGVARDAGEKGGSLPGTTGGSSITTLDRPDPLRGWLGGQGAGAMGDIRRVVLRKKADQAAFAGAVRVTISHEISGPIVVTIPELSYSLEVAAGAPTTELLAVEKTIGSEELARHVTDNALYYTQAILRGVDATIFTQLLSGFSLGGRPAIEMVDPLPAAITGNYLAFRIPRQTDEDDASWQAWLAARDIRMGERKEDFVPLPSGGVFAEAVLGRFNSAEKLDMTRFWNWQDSPIPIVPTEIAALQAGSRARETAPETGQLSPPVLNIVNPPALPDPTGMAGALAAIQNGNAFRDMSGLAATIGFAQAAMTRSADAARDAASTAAQNMRTAADIYGAAFGGSGGARAPQNVSEKGAAINQGRDMDRRGVPEGGAGNGAGGGGSGAAPRPPASSGGAPGVEVAETSWEARAMQTGLGQLTDTVTQAAPGGLGGQIAEKAVDAGVGLAGKLIEAGLTSLSVVPQFDVSAPGLNDSSMFSHVLLAGYEDPRMYVPAGEGVIHIQFNNIGAAGVLFTTEGFSGTLSVEWEDCHLDAGEVKPADAGRTAPLRSVICKRNIRFLWRHGSAQGLDSAFVRARLGARSLRAEARMSGAGAPSFRVEAVVSFGYTESALLSPFVVSTSAAFELLTVTDPTLAQMQIVQIWRDWNAQGAPRFRVDRGPFI